MAEFPVHPRLAHLLLAARDKPLFETLKDSPTTEIAVPAHLQGRAEGGKAMFNVDLRNTGKYARLVRVKAEWNGPQGKIPYLVLFSDNYFDLLPGETRWLKLEVFLPEGHSGKVTGILVVEATNAARKQIALELQGD